MSAKLEKYRGLFIACTAIGVCGLSPIYWIGAVFGFMGLVASPSSWQKKAAIAVVVIALLLQLTFVVLFIKTLAGKERCSSITRVYDRQTQQWMYDCWRVHDDEALLGALVSGLLSLIAGSLAMALADFAMQRAFVDPATNALRTTRTAMLAATLIGVLCFPPLYWIMVAMCTLELKSIMSRFNNTDVDQGWFCVVVSRCQAIFAL
jgi:hypothetical protein